MLGSSVSTSANRRPSQYPGCICRPWCRVDGDPKADGDGVVSAGDGTDVYRQAGGGFTSDGSLAGDGTSDNQGGIGINSIAEGDTCGILVAFVGNSNEVGEVIAGARQAVVIDIIGKLVALIGLDQRRCGEWCDGGVIVGLVGGIIGGISSDGGAGDEALVGELCHAKGQGAIGDDHESDGGAAVRSRDCVQVDCYRVISGTVALYHAAAAVVTLPIPVWN